MMRSIFFSLCFLSFTMLQSQVINGGMETYTYTAFDTLPTHWSVKTNYGSLRGQTADAHGGSYAFVINSWYYYGIDMLINGTIEQADMPNQWIKAGHEVTGKPTTLKGFYKYTETLVTDSAIAEVILKKWNTLKNKPDTIAYGSTRLPPTQTYLEFEVAIKDYAVGVQPDSVVIKFTSHDPKNIGMPAVANSRYLYIDDLSLVEPVGLNETIKNDGLSCFYANNELRILNKEMKTFTLNIYSIEGTLFLSREVSEPESTINISHLSNGIYLIKTNGKINMQQKFYKD